MTNAIPPEQEPSSLDLESKPVPESGLPSLAGASTNLVASNPPLATLQPTVKSTEEAIKRPAKSFQLISMIIGFSFLISGILGLIRGALVAARFGAGIELDAYIAAARLPETLFNLVAGGALASAFIPVFTRLWEKDSREAAYRMTNSVLSLVFLVGLILSILAVIFSPLITLLQVPNFSVTEQALVGNMMRIMLLTVTIFSVSGLVMGILNAHQHFTAPALAPSMNNLGVILGVLLLVPSLGVYGLAWGSVLGALLHFGIQIPTLLKLDFKLHWSPHWRTAGVLEVLKLMLPRMIGQGMVQLNFFVNTMLASLMDEGSISALQYAFQLMFTILGVLGQSVGTAIFPTLSVYGAEENWDGFRETLAGAVRNVLFTTIPVAFGVLVVAASLIATIYERGEWTADATTATAWALQFYAIGLPAFALQEILTRAFFAFRNTVIPVTVVSIGVLANIGLSVMLITLFAGQARYVTGTFRGAFVALAFSNVLVTIVETFILWNILRRKVGSLQSQGVVTMMLRTILAGLVMFIVVYIINDVMANQLLWDNPFIRLVICGVVGAIVYEVSALMLDIPEARSVPNVVLSRLNRQR